MGKVKPVLIVSTKLSSNEPTKYRTIDFQFQMLKNVQTAVLSVSNDYFCAFFFLRPRSHHMKNVEPL